MREPVIKSMAEKVIAHAAANGGSCHWCFVKDLVNGNAKVAPSMKTTCDNIDKKVRAIQGPCEQLEVSPVIPYHFICYPSLSTNADSSVSASLNSKRANVQILLDVLANQTVQTFQPTSHTVESMQPTCPNQFSYKGCGTSLHLVLEHCSSCLRLVHPICQKFSGRKVAPLGLLKKKADFVTHQDTTTAQDSSIQSTQEVRDNVRADYARLQAALATLIPQDAEVE
jgi:hypothetical protein